MDKHLERCINIVEELLKEATPKKKDVKDLMIWQRGYLTGILASLIKNDSINRHELEKRIKHYKDRK